MKDFTKEELAILFEKGCINAGIRSIEYGEDAHIGIAFILKTIIRLFPQEIAKTILERWPLLEKEAKDIK